MIWVSPDNTDGPEDVQVANDFLKIAVRLSHAPSVVICFLHEKESFSSEMSKSDCIQGVMSLVKALQALNKKITIVTQHHAQLMQDGITSNATQGRGVPGSGISVLEWDESCDIMERLYQGNINHRLDTMIGLEVARENFPEENDVKGYSRSDLVDTLFEEGLSNVLSSLWRYNIDQIFDNLAILVALKIGIIWTKILN